MSRSEPTYRSYDHSQLILRQLPATLGLHLVAITWLWLALALDQAGHQPMLKKLVIVWLAIAVLRLGHSLYVRFHVHDARLAERHGQLAVYLSVANGLWIGLTMLWCLETYEGAARYHTVFLTCFFVSWGVNAAASINRFMVILGPVCWPVLGWLLLDKNPDSKLLALGLAGFMVLPFRYFISMRDRLRWISEVEAENLQLIEGLESQKQQAEAAKETAEEALHEADRAHAQRMRFFAAASHDLRQPLYALQLLSSSLENANASDVRHIGQHIRDNVEALSEEFSQLLDLTRLDSGVIANEPVPLLLDQLFGHLESQFQPIAAASGNELLFKPCQILLHADPSLLRGVLSNLIDNAIRYTPEGGRIWVGWRAARRSIEVRDSGIGIPEALHGAIFEEFFQVNNPQRDRTRGHGLGLATTQRLAQRMGAEVLVRSAPEKGSVFALCLPESVVSPSGVENVAPLLPQRETSQGMAFQGKRVLYIDDDIAVQRAVAILFSQWGARCFTVSDAASARAWIAANPVPPDLIISDLRLPDVSDNAAYLQELRQYYGGRVPVVVITGDLTAAQNGEWCRDAGILSKPVSASELASLAELIRPAG